MRAALCRNSSRQLKELSQLPIGSIKEEVKKKHFSLGWKFSCFSAHTIERELFGPTAPCARLRGTVPQRFGFSLPAVFIASWQRSLSVPKPAKQNVVKFGDHSSIGDSWPIAFSGYPRGPSLDYSRFCWRKKKRCSKRWMNTGF